MTVVVVDCSRENGVICGCDVGGANAQQCVDVVCAISSDRSRIYHHFKELYFLSSAFEWSETQRAATYGRVKTVGEVGRILPGWAGLQISDL